MRKSSRRRREPPRPAPPPSGQPEEYSLEEILNEFGGWSRRGTEPEAPPEEAPASDVSPEQAPAADVPPEQAPESGEAPEAEPAAAEAAAPPRTSRFRFVEMKPSPPAEAVEPSAPESGPAEPPAEGPEKADGTPEARVWTYRGPDAPPQAEPAARRRTERRAPEPVPDSPEPSYPEPEEAYRAARKRTGSLRLRRRLVFLLTLAAVAVTALRHFEVPLGSFVLGEQLAAQILVGLLLAGAFLSYDVLVGGVYDALRLRPGLETLLAVTVVVIAADGFRHMGAGNARMSAAAVALLGLFYALWGRVLGNRARRRSLKTVLSMGEEPLAAVLSRRAWGSRDCLFRRPGDRTRFVADLEAPTAVDRVMGIYAPAVLLLTLAAAVVLRLVRDRSFLVCWSTMLAGALPVAAAVTYWRPMAALAAQLARAGAALCGWRGARLLSGPCCVAVEDKDLFARNNVSMNGMKVFGDYNVSQVVGYTYAAIEKSGSGLEPVFRDVFANQNGRRFTVDGFRRYEGGGIGAEIQGDVVLVGSIAFMRLMGVEMPEGTNVRQAVYCSVNQKLAAVFAIHYAPSQAVRSGLTTILRCRGLSLLLATRDFILTPAMVRHKYKLPADALEYPTADERARLSGPYAAVGSEQAALLGRDSFLPLAEAAAGGRSLLSSVLAGLGVNLLGGVLGLGITVVLCWLGAFTAASSFNMMLFALLWTLPALLLTTLAGK